MGKGPWFKNCTWYKHAPEAFHRRSSLHWTYLRIARLPKEVGEALDEAGAPVRVYRFVAWGKGGAERRHALVLHLRALLGRWPNDAQMYQAESAEGPEAEEEGPSSSAA